MSILNCINGRSGRVFYLADGAETMVPNVEQALKTAYRL